MPEVNEIDWMYLQWSVDNKDLFIEDKVEPEVVQAILESYDKVGDMLKEIGESLEELRESGFLDKLSVMTETLEK